jgi:hypothetical protein
MEDQEPSKVETIVKVCVLLWSATLLSLSYYEPPSGKKIVDFDPTFIASIFSASTASLGFQIKKKKDTIVDNKNSNCRRYNNIRENRWNQCWFFN